MLENKRSPRPKATAPPNSFPENKPSKKTRPITHRKKHWEADIRAFNQKLEALKV